jgi:hypothetical protein
MLLGLDLHVKDLLCLVFAYRICLSTSHYGIAYVWYVLCVSILGIISVLCHFLCFIIFSVLYHYLCCMLCARYDHASQLIF